MKKDNLIGFIGQGWIGKHYADDFEKRGYDVVRYALEEPYIKNGDKIKDCDIVFIAVPTPSTLEGFDDSIVRKAIKGVGQGKIHASARVNPVYSKGKSGYYSNAFAGVFTRGLSRGGRG